MKPSYKKDVKSNRSVGLGSATRNWFAHVGTNTPESRRIWKSKKSNNKK